MEATLRLAQLQESLDVIAAHYEEADRIAKYIPRLVGACQAAGCDPSEVSAALRTSRQRVLATYFKPEYLFPNQGSAPA